jgi:hypothetical protein
MHEKLHNEFISYLETFKIDEDVLELFDDVMMDIWKQR